MITPIEYADMVKQLAADRLDDPVERAAIEACGLQWVHGFSADFVDIMGETIQHGALVRLYGGHFKEPLQLAHVTIHELGHVLSEIPPIKQWRHGPLWKAACLRMGAVGTETDEDVTNGDYAPFFCSDMLQEIRDLPAPLFHRASRLYPSWL